MYEESLKKSSVERNQVKSRRNSCKKSESLLGITGATTSITVSCNTPDGSLERSVSSVAN